MARKQSPASAYSGENDGFRSTPMRIGIPRETKEGERRVALDPAAVRTLVRAGNAVTVEAGAGSGVGHGDEGYRASGAKVGSAGEAWNAELVVKVKEVQDADLAALAPGVAIFGFQHLVGEPEMTRTLAARGVTALAFELVRDAAGGFPLLAPMSVIAGRLAVLAGAHHLMLAQGGNGTLLAGAPGAEPARVLVLGAGHAGMNAAEVAQALGAHVVVLTRSGASRDRVRERFGERVQARLASPAEVEREALAADLVIGAVFVPGAPTPKLLSRGLVRRMKRGAVIVDVSIDAGGVAETSRPTTHADPTFVEEGVVHYCVPNMPAAVARAGAAALCAAVLPYVREISRLGLEGALASDAGLRAGIVLWKGGVVHPGIAAESGLPLARLDVSLPASPAP